MAGREDFEEFVAARMPALLRTAYLLTGNHHDAEDLVQTALVKAVPHWKRMSGNPDAYVRRILVHENISRWRRRKWREVSAEHAAEPVAPSELTDERLALHGALGKLAPRQRAVIVLRYFDDLTEAETARLMGTSVGTVKSQTRDALARLRALIPDIDGEWALSSG